MPKLTDLEVEETSLCAKGMNPHARVALFKKAPDGDAPAAVRLAKVCCESERGATMFAQAAEAEAKDRAYWKATEDVGAALCAVSTSVRSIVADATLTPDARASMLKESIAQFAASVAGTDGLEAMTKSVEKLAADFSDATVKTSKGTPPSTGEAEMTDLEKAQAEIETLKKAQADAAAKLAKAEALAKLSDAAKSYVAKMSDEDKEKFMAKPKGEQDGEVAKAAELAKAADETLTVGTATIRKSEVGAGAFAVMKAQNEAIAKQAEEIAKANDRAEMAILTKRAAEEFAHLPGTDVEKAAVLKSLADLPEDVRKTQEAILKAAEATAKFAFEKRGISPAAPGAANGGDYLRKVAEIEGRDKCAKTEAMRKARIEAPEAFAAWQDSQAIAAN